LQLAISEQFLPLLQLLSWPAGHAISQHACRHVRFMLLDMHPTTSRLSEALC